MREKKNDYWTWDANGLSKQNMRILSYTSIFQLMTIMFF